MKRTTTKSEPFFSGIIDDQPASEDFLDFETYAQAFTQMILHQDTKTPLTLGIYGHWGTGKTSLMRMIEKRVKSEGIPTVWFDAWQYSKEDELWAAFLQSILNRIKDELNWIQNIRFSMSLLLHRIDKEKLPGQILSYSVRFIMAIMPLAIALLASQQMGQQIYQITTQLTGGVVTMIFGWLVFLKPFVQAIQDNVSIDFSVFQKDSDYKNHIAFLDNFREHFGDIVKSLPKTKGEKQGKDDEAAKSKKLVVFIDDLDRCSPHDVLQVLDAVKVFVNVPGCIYVIGLDMEVTEKAIAKKYPDNLIAQRQYLGKIIELSFQLPPLTAKQMESFTQHLSVEFPDERCQSVFVESLIPNPREIKRAINVFSLLWFLSRTRYELAESINPVRLAKIVVIQRSHPDFYRLLLKKPMLLAELENYLHRVAKSTEGQRDESEQESILDPDLEPFVEHALLRRLLLLELPGDATNFGSLTQEELMTYFTLTRQAPTTSERHENDNPPLATRIVTLTPRSTILNGKYRVLHLIGEGGMCRVWLAQDLTFANRPVAIKEPHPGLGSTDSEELHQRFQRELRISVALAESRTPNIVQALTLESFEDGLLLVLEYMPGGELTQKILAHPSGMPLEDVITIAKDVLKALAAIHNHPVDIVHRDIKPSNILFDADGRARIGDFGLAQVGALTTNRSMMMERIHPGTPLYMAPEQETGYGYLTPAADIYSMGAVLFEMLTGEKYKLSLIHI